MADISKCNGVGCKIRGDCYRYLVPASELWQSFSPYELHTLNIDKYGNQTCEAKM